MTQSDALKVLPHTNPVTTVVLRSREPAPTQSCLDKQVVVGQRSCNLADPSAAQRRIHSFTVDLKEDIYSHQHYCMAMYLCLLCMCSDSLHYSSRIIISYKMGEKNSFLSSVYLFPVTHPS